MKTLTVQIQMDRIIAHAIMDMKAMVSIAQVNYILKGIHSDSTISMSY